MIIILKRYNGYLEKKFNDSFELDKNGINFIFCFNRKQPHIFRIMINKTYIVTKTIKRNDFSTTSHIGID